MKEKVKVLYWKVKGKKETWLCPSCLKAGHLGNRHGARPARCACSEENLISLGSRKLAEWVSQNQGDSKAILQVFDSWNYQGHFITQARLAIWIYGFEYGGVRFLHPDRINKLVRDGAAFRVGKPICSDDVIWLIEKGKRYEVRPIESQ